MTKTTTSSANAVRASYQLPPSLLAHLPWVEFDDASQCVLLHDKTIGAVFELTPVSSEAKPDVYLQQLRDGLQGLFQDTFPQYVDSASPWIVQCYVNDEASMASVYDAIENYIKPTAQDSPFKDTYLNLMKAHYDWLSQPGGVFYDNKVIDGEVRGGLRKVRLCVYRQYSSQMTLSRGRTAIQDMNQVATRLVSKLNGVGIACHRLQGDEFRDWLIRWFNPKPAMAEGNCDKLIASIPKINNKDEHPFGYDFAEHLFYSVPKSDEDNGVWYFDGLPHRYITIQNLSRVPELGQLTRERPFSHYHYGLFDKFPEGASFVMTVVIQAQDSVKNHLARIEETARKSRTTAATLTFEDCQVAKAAIEQGNYLYPTTLGVYLRGHDLDDLSQKETAIEGLLVNNGFQLLNQDHELLPIHSYLHQLPFCYHYQFDKQYLFRSNYVFAKQLRNENQP